jgi:hypothetical protein
MSDLSAAPRVAAEPQRPTGFIANLIDLYFSPAEAFANMLRKPSFLVPLVLQIALGAAFSAIWLQKVDKVEFMKAQVEQSTRWERVPVEQRATILQRQASAIPAFTWGFALVGGPLMTVILAAIFLFVFRFFYASEVTFKQAITIVASMMVAVGLVATPLLLGVLALKGDWNIDPAEALSANLSILFDKQTAAKPLWALASSLDLFMFWRLFLLAAGFGAAAKRNWTWALTGILIPWVLMVAIKVGFSLMS